MFDFNKLADLSKITNEARQLQERQERTAQRQTQLLEKISDQIETVIKLLKSGG